MRNKIINYMMVSAAVFSLTLSSCKDSVSGTDLDNKEIPASNVSYSQHIQPIFELKCNNSGCHDDGSRAGGLALTSWQSTTSSALIVFPGEPANSKLVQVINGSSPIMMPPEGYPPLTTNQVNGITTWVKEGAKNN